MQPHHLAWCAALVPVLTAHACYLLSAATGTLDWCLPYGPDCVSISASGRYPPAYYLFKALVLPSSVVMALYWGLMWHWLTLLGELQKSRRWILCLGCVAAVALILYATFLGAEGAPYRFQRRIGVILFFALTAFNHLLLLQLFDSEWGSRVNTRLLPLFKLISWILLIMGVFNAPLSSWDGFKRYEDAYEWWFALAMMTQFAIVARVWQLTGFRLVARVDMKP